MKEWEKKFDEAENLVEGKYFLTCNNMWPHVPLKTMLQVSFRFCSQQFLFLDVRFLVVFSQMLIYVYSKEVNDVNHNYQ